jgi:hypothetical protein
MEWLFYGGPYHPIPLLEKDQYEMIRRLRLIVYHHNLHMWYMVVCIDGMCGIGYYWKFYLDGISEIYDFFISIVFSFPFGDIVNFLKNLIWNFHFKFKKWKFSNLKNKNFHFFHFNFSWPISKSFFQFFPFPMDIFSKFKNKKFQFKFQKYFFPKCFISNFPYNINEFYS